MLGASIASAQNLTGPQRNAVRSAESYLSFTGFSRAGLIDQLSSSYGDGYDVADATAAEQPVVLVVYRRHIAGCGLDADPGR
uniref:Ltp family lipoprotein n=1 Tax=Yoonia sp. TaxID=2212373 RepID=UPI0040482345